MSSLPVYVGLDYHQDSIQVCILSKDGKQLHNRSVANDAAAVRDVAQRFGEPRRIAIEACCGSADLAEELTTMHGLPVQLAHPGYVNRMKRSPDKHDVGDAQLLADLVRVNYLPRVWLAPRPIRELRRLMRHRTQLVRRRKDAKLRIRALLRENRVKCPKFNAWTKGWFAWLHNEAELSESDRWIVEDHLEELLSLTGRIAALEAKIRLRVKDDPVVALLMSMQGVGLVTAATLRAEVGRFDRFDNGKQLARFCGVTPRNVSSGQRQADAGLIKAGNPDLRAILIEVAQRLIHRIKGEWMRFANKMLDRGKPKNVVVAAVANRWVRRLYHELKSCAATQSTSAPAPQKGAVPSAYAIAST